GTSGLHPHRKPGYRSVMPPADPRLERVGDAFGDVDPQALFVPDDLAAVIQPVAFRVGDGRRCFVPDGGEQVGEVVGVPHAGPGVGDLGGGGVRVGRLGPGAAEVGGDPLRVVGNDHAQHELVSV